MKRLAALTAVLSIIASAGLTAPTLGCGCHDLVCICADGERLEDSCTTLTEELQCPDMCQARGGWSGTCADERFCRSEALDGGADAGVPDGG